MFPLLGVLFLDHLLKLVRFLAQLREGLLYRIGFLSFYASLSGAEIGFFRSVFLKMTAIASIVRRVRTPMLLAKVAVFLGTSFPWDSGTVVSTRLLGTFFYRCAKFSHCKKQRTLWIFPGHLFCCVKLSRRKKRWFYWIFPGHTHAQLPQVTEGANTCPQKFHLSCED